MLRMDQVHVIRPKVLIERQSICSGVFSRTVGTNLRGRPESACTQGSLGAWRKAVMRDMDFFECYFKCNTTR
jgi:hypothetical protein